MHPLQKNCIIRLTMRPLTDRGENMLNYAIRDNRLVKIPIPEFKLFENPATLTIANPDELSDIADITRVHPYTMEESREANHHARLDIHPEYSFGIFSAIEIEQGEIIPLDFAFYLTNCSLLLVCNDGNNLLGEFIRKFTDGNFIPQFADLTPQTLLLTLLTDVIEKNDAEIEELETILEELEEDILSDVRREHSQQIFSNKRLIMQLKHHIEPLVYIIESINDNENGLFSEMHLKSLHLIVYKATRMLDNVVLLRDYATQVREAFEAEQDIRSNELMKVFTVITSIFMPLTLLVGWYGMNFRHMPELYWIYGYPFVMVMSLAVVGAMLVFFKRKRWF